jgi:uncharacterized protein (UPF0335 family)
MTDTARPGDVGGIAGAHLRSFVERLERLAEERKALADDISDVFKDAVSAGFDKQVLKEVLKIRAKNPSELDEMQSMVEVYLRALDGASLVRAREAAE